MRRGEQEWWTLGGRRTVRAAAIRLLVRAGLLPTDDEREAQVRRAQVFQILTQQPTSATLSTIAGIGLVTVLWGAIAPQALVGWLVMVIAFNVARRTHAKLLMRDEVRLARAARQPWQTVIVAMTAAGLFTIPGVYWFEFVGFEGRMTICIVLTGMISAGCVALSPVPAAAFAYTLILSVGLMIEYYTMGRMGLVGMTTLFGLALMRTVIVNWRRLVAFLRIEGELAEKSQLVELLRAFDASGSSWVWEVDAGLKITMMSREMEQALGHAPQSSLRRPAHEVLDPSGRGAAMSSGFRALAESSLRGKEFRDLAIPVLDGQRWWSLSGKPVHGPRGEVVGWRGVGSDITDVRLTGSDSIATARRDPLTGLANRLLIREMVEESLLRNAAGGPTCVLLLIDLDRFKQVNDTLGHAVGDQLLCLVAARLKAATKGLGQVGRLGGDEFAILLPDGAATRDLDGFCERLIANLSERYTVGEATLVIGASVGIAWGPLDGADDIALIRSADLALYRAKDGGRAKHVFYAPHMLAEAQESRLLESDVRGALGDGQLSLVYQPIVDAETLEVIGREALLRWNHPERGPIAPDRFIPIIEDLGLIGQIGSWVIHQACVEAARWPDGQRVAVNISVAQLTGANLSATVVAALAASGLAPDRLELEVTESIFLGDDPSTIRSLASLRALGVRLVLDDFGTGYSSFGYLSRASFAKIKIDRLFVRGAAAGCRQSRAIVGSILALAQGLDIETTAEGIETAEEAELMRGVGCTQLQGYYFGYPEPLEGAGPIRGARDGNHARIAPVARFG